MNGLIMSDTAPRKSSRQSRIRIGLVTLLLGFLVFVLGLAPEMIALNRSSVTGFVQLSVSLIGLAFICIGGYVVLNTLWNGRQKSILADIGIRIVATGYVIAFASGLADVFGIGSQPFPNIPSFGPIQVIGMLVGEATIVIGFIMFIPNPRKEKEEVGAD